MFTLRRISQNGVQMNYQIGHEYTLIMREYNYRDFAETFELKFKRPLADDNKPDSDDASIHAFLVNGSEILPLYRDQPAYIMSENGTTFDNVSYR